MGRGGDEEVEAGGSCEGPRLPVPKRQVVAAQDRGAEFKIVIDKTDGKELGVNIQSLDGLDLPINAVLTGGLVQQWNDYHPELALKPGDSIVEVNGIRNGSPKLLQEC